MSSLKIKSLFEGHGRGAMLPSAFGLLNAVTEYVDHERKAKSNDQRLDLVWLDMHWMGALH